MAHFVEELQLEAERGELGTEDRAHARAELPREPRQLDEGPAERGEGVGEGRHDVLRAQELLQVALAEGRPRPDDLRDEENGVGDADREPPVRAHRDLQEDRVGDVDRLGRPPAEVAEELTPDEDPLGAKRGLPAVGEAGDDEAGEEEHGPEDGPRLARHLAECDGPRVEEDDLDVEDDEEHGDEVEFDGEARVGGAARLHAALVGGVLGGGSPGALAEQQRDGEGPEGDGGREDQLDQEGDELVAHRQAFRIAGPAGLPRTKRHAGGLRERGRGLDWGGARRRKWRWRFGTWIWRERDPGGGWSLFAPLLAGAFSG